MKRKMITVLLTSAMVLGLMACGKTEEAAPNVEETVEEAAPETTEAAADTTEAAADTTEAASDASASAVMSYADYAAAPVDSEVTVETYVQAKQGWWENEGVGMATFYTQDEDGAYFLYNMPCSKDDYDKMTTGTKIRVNGFKSEWSGEVEITDATYEIIDGNYVASAKDVTDMLGTDELANYMNQFVSCEVMHVEAANDEGAAFLYNWDGSGSQGDDLYFNLSSNDKTYTFCVESYLCGPDTDVYKAVENLKVGDFVELEGFLYWYEGPQMHVTDISTMEFKSN